MMDQVVDMTDAAALEKRAHEVLPKLQEMKFIKWAGDDAFNQIRSISISEGNSHFVVELINGIYGKFEVAFIYYECQLTAWTACLINRKYPSLVLILTK